MGRSGGDGFVWEVAGWAEGGWRDGEVCVEICAAVGELAIGT